MNAPTALITGASSGIGKELARRLAPGCRKLVLTARDLGALEALAAELRQRHTTEVLVLPCDLADPAAPEQIYDQLQAQGVAVDVLVNNAGFNVYGPLAEADLAATMSMIQVNLVALTALTRLFLPGMVERGRGRILNVGSTGSFAPGPLVAVYCATKAYVLSFSEAVAEELRGTGVTVTALCPGPTATGFAARASMTGTPLFQGPLMSAAEVARQGCDALNRGQTVKVTGLANQALVFSIRLSPRGVVRKIGKKMMAR